MKIKGKLMDAESMNNTFRRLAHQIIEKNEGAEDLVIIGIRTRGVTVAKRIKECIDSIEGANVPMGVFDIALYRDDLGSPGADVEFFGSEISFGVDGKTVLLCDDVLYTGRTVRAAISEVMQLGAAEEHTLPRPYRPRPSGAPLQSGFYGQERAYLGKGGDRRPLF